MAPRSRIGGSMVGRTGAPIAGTPVPGAGSAPTRCPPATLGRGRALATVWDVPPDPSPRMRARASSSASAGAPPAAAVVVRPDRPLHRRRLRARGVPGARGPDPDELRGPAPDRLDSGRQVHGRRTSARSPARRVSRRCASPAGPGTSAAIGPRRSSCSRPRASPPTQMADFYARAPASRPDRGHRPIDADRRGPPGPPDSTR